VLRTSDGREFDKARVIPYAYRHTYAQRHADADVAPDVLRDLMDHTVLDTTRLCYRVGEKRRRAAVDRLASLHFDRHGNRIWTTAQALLDSDYARRAVGEVSVPFGTCREPSNVAAAGHACPFRFRCVGCGHFRTDASYLPDLNAYLGDLLRTRERRTAALAAAPGPDPADGGIDRWAAADAMPSGEEISRLRALISRVTAGLDNLTTAERAEIDEAVAVVRRHRTVLLGMPRTPPPGQLPRPAAPRQRTPGAAGVTAQPPARAADARAAAMAAGRRADTERRRQRVLKALEAAAAAGEEVSVSAIARRAAVDRTFLYRHRDLLARVHAREAQPSAQTGGGPAVTRASLQADLLTAHERSARLAARIRQLENCLSGLLGEQAWRESGLGQPDDIGDLKQQITRLTEDNQQLRAGLAERDQDLAAARAANRELMTRLNTQA
jgi:hypothetical protein